MSISISDPLNKNRTFRVPSNPFGIPRSFANDIAKMMANHKQSRKPRPEADSMVPFTEEVSIDTDTELWINIKLGAAGIEEDIEAEEVLSEEPGAQLVYDATAPKPHEVVGNFLHEDAAPAHAIPKAIWFDPKIFWGEAAEALVPTNALLGVGACEEEEEDEYKDIPSLVDEPVRGIPGSVTDEELEMVLEEWLEDKDEELPPLTEGGGNKDLPLLVEDKQDEEDIQDEDTQEEEDEEDEEEEQEEETSPSNKDCQIESVAWVDWW